jgi:hypothetical protein
MLQVLGHQPGGQVAIARGQRTHDLDVFVVRVLGVAPGLVHQRDQRAARDQLPSICASTSLPISSAMRT